LQIISYSDALLVQYQHELDQETDQLFWNQEWWWIRLLDNRSLI